MASCVDLHHCKLNPVVPSPRASRHCPPSLAGPFLRPPPWELKLILGRSSSTWRLSAPPDRIRLFFSPLDALPDQEDERSHQSIERETINLDKTQGGGNQFKKRVVFGLGIGLGVGGVVFAGGWVFAIAMAAAVFTGAREYFELVSSRGIAAGMTPPPRYVTRVCSIICAIMPLLTMYSGHVDVAVTLFAFVIAMALTLQRGNPRFAQLSSAMFGLFYCGYLPCFWVKLRCGLANPALNTITFNRTRNYVASTSWWSSALDCWPSCNLDLL